MSFFLQPPSMSPNCFSTDVPFPRYRHDHSSCGSKWRRVTLSHQVLQNLLQTNTSASPCRCTSACSIISCLGYFMKLPHRSSHFWSCFSTTWLPLFEPQGWSCHLCVNLCNGFSLPLADVHGSPGPSWLDLWLLLLAFHFILNLPGIQDLRCSEAPCPLSLVAA